ncbi:hypothetical protein B0J12DRAFT_741600 [Macrophomina phaseolina]|uniref:Uncharacterized protein n=1 Tax=Macrophomina phaseolina TaxID=35725 RepID=A0ABQ8G763_9PEZI|nr:hypothetical protein B0J12DRAFT_741600 [Macrophomina phaseolina]
MTDCSEATKIKYNVIISVLVFALAAALAATFHYWRESRLFAFRLQQRTPDLERGAAVELSELQHPSSSSSFVSSRKLVDKPGQPSSPSSSFSSPSSAPSDDQHDPHRIPPLPFTHGAPTNLSPSSTVTTTTPLPTPPPLAYQQTFWHHGISAFPSPPHQQQQRWSAGRERRLTCGPSGLRAEASVVAGDNPYALSGVPTEEGETRIGDVRRKGRAVMSTARTVEKGRAGQGWERVL